MATEERMLCDCCQENEGKVWLHHDELLCFECELALYHPEECRCGNPKPKHQSCCYACYQESYDRR